MSTREFIPQRRWNGCPSGYSRDGDWCEPYGDWYWWGRWVLAGAVVLIVLIVLVSCSCIARRRRRRGAVPMYGTGWMAGGHGKNGQQNYEMHNQGAWNQQGYSQGQGQGQGGYGGGFNPPPAYGQQQPQYTGTTFNPNDGYYGAQQPQSPPHVYQQDNQYAPPQGPPPGK